MKQNEIIYFKFPWDRIGITQYFSSKHQAIDNAGNVSGKVNKYAYLPCEAKILKNTYYSDYGYAVEYQAKDKRGTFVMADGHLKKQSSLVIGKTYPMGTIIGEIGSTGTSTANHDHFRMSLNGTRVNPLDYLYVYDGQFVHNDDIKKVKYLKQITKTYEIIVDKILIYNNASDAKNNKNSRGYYSKGVYYIFNEANGMINVTKKIGVAGAWINPNDNKKINSLPSEEIDQKEDVVEEIPVKDDDHVIDKPSEEITQPIEEVIKKENIFIKIMKSIVNFILKIFKR